MNSPHKGQWRGALVFSLICTRINGWVNNREADDFRRHRAHYYVIVMMGLCRPNEEKFISYWKGGLNLSHMPCTAQLGGPVLKASGQVQYTPFGPGDKSPKITDQHTAGGSVSQLSQLTKLSPWLTLSTKDITTSFWYYNTWFWFLSNQIMDLYHFSPNRIQSVHLLWKTNMDYPRSRI